MADGEKSKSNLAKLMGATPIKRNKKKKKKKEEGDAGIGVPYAVQRVGHVGYDHATETFVGLPPKWKALLGMSNLSANEIQDNPEAVLACLKFQNDYLEGKNEPPPVPHQQRLPPKPKPNNPPPVATSPASWNAKVTPKVNNQVFQTSRVSYYKDENKSPIGQRKPPPVATSPSRGMGQRGSVRGPRGGGSFRGPRGGNRGGMVQRGGGGNSPLNPNKRQSNAPNRRPPPTPAGNGVPRGGMNQRGINRGGQRGMNRGGMGQRGGGGSVRGPRGGGSFRGPRGGNRGGRGGMNQRGRGGMQNNQPNNNIQNNNNQQNNYNNNQQNNFNNNNQQNNNQQAAVSAPKNNWNEPDPYEEEEEEYTGPTLPDQKIEDVVCPDNPRERYINLEKVGQGASGIVYVADDLVTGNKAAVKEMILDQQPNKDIIVNEILLMKECNHPGIVNFIESYLCEGIQIGIHFLLLLLLMIT
eukprot:TRINITY_DN3888_c0_g1_i1.p1 TRINITY_DN3888_c0_g1~~TRINITY_DN3888_c0_g1_i1.p1  ORF type:complete len:468 (+),score=258.91 TRINITY_DN3888_c0_g1_i1:205-1608(+)